MIAISLANGLAHATTASIDHPRVRNEWHPLEILLGMWLIIQTSSLNNAIASLSCVFPGSSLRPLQLAHSNVVDTCSSLEYNSIHYKRH